MRIKFKLFCLLLLLGYQIIKAQDLTGKWMPVHDDFTFFVPTVPIYEISQSEFRTYDFDSLYSSFDQSKETFDVDEFKNEIIIENEFTFKEIVKDLNDSIHYITNVRLLNTKLNHPIDSILLNQYETFFKKSFIRPNPELITFNKELGNNVLLERFGDKFSKKYKLDKIDETYFIAFYSGGKRKRVFPISEVNKDYLIIYGVPEIDDFIKLHVIKEIKRINRPFED